MIRLLLVEDDLLVGQGLYMALKQAPGVTIVGEAHTIAEALRLAQALSPQVVLMDLSLPLMEDITATATLHAAAPHSAVVFLSLQDDLTRRAQALAAGAYAFVGKQEGVKALLAAIYKAGSQECQFHPHPAWCGNTE